MLVRMPGSPSMCSTTGTMKGLAARARRPTTSLDTCGTLRWMSTGLPNVMSEAMPSERRKAAAW